MLGSSFSASCKHSPKPRKYKPALLIGKVILTVFWEKKEVLAEDYTINGNTVNGVS